MNNYQSLQKIYQDPASGFLSADKLYRKVKQIDNTITRKQVKEFLQSQPTHQKTTTQKPVKVQQRTMNAPPNTFQMDLTFFPQYAKFNDKYSGLLTCINMVSRMGYAYPVKSKKPADIITALKDLLNDIDKSPTERAKGSAGSASEILTFQSDRGTEFKNKQVEKYLTEHNVAQIFLTAKHQSGMIERFNRTLKSYILKYFLQYSTVRWIDVLPAIIYNYNHSFHSSIQKEPAEVDFNDEHEIFLKSLLIPPSQTDTSSLLNKLVRIRLPKQLFDKEGQIWSDEEYIVKSLSGNTATLENIENSKDTLKRSIKNLLVIPFQTFTRKTRQSIPNQIPLAKKSAKISRALARELKAPTT